VHLEDVNEVDTTAHFMAADVLIDSRSTFSFNAAMFNPNCVIHQASWFKAPELKNWQNVRGRLKEVGNQCGENECKLSKAHAKMDDVEIINNWLPGCLEHFRERKMEAILRN
jgi:hypothetical protein